MRRWALMVALSVCAIGVGSGVFRGDVRANGSSDDRDAKPLIQSASPNFNDNTLTIRGTGFGRRAPRVRLTEIELRVKSASPTEVVAWLPAGGVAPASYRLSLTTQHGGY